MITFLLLSIKVNANVLIQSPPFALITICHPIFFSFIASLDSISLPNKVFEALAYPSWHSAMIEEIDALTDNGTWDLVRLPAGKKAIGCRWVFTIKVNLNELIARLKVNLVAKGYAHTYGVDYSKTFSSVAKLTSIQLFLSLAATHG